jgi:large repetitive protein
MSNAVATVAFLQGKAWAKSPDGELRPLTVGSVLNANDILVTGLNAKVELDTGDLQWLTISGGQEVSMSRDLRTESATTNEEARLTDATVQEALTILEQGGDLLEELEETAAGNTAGAGGSSHGFVQLTRLIEQTDPLAFDFDAANAGSPSVLSTDTEFPRNNPPEVVDQQLVFDEDTVLTGQIIATDIENDTLTYTVATQPTNGVLVLDAVTGSFTFTPNSNFNGLDSFVVSVTDTAGNSVNNTISLTINPVNDAPVSSAQPIVTNEDTPVTGQIVATDVENDVLSFVVSTNPANGVVTINAATGAYEYTPNANF